MNPLIQKWEELNGDNSQSFNSIDYDSIRPCTTFDVETCKDTFLQVAEMLPKDNARVLNMTMKKGWLSNTSSEKRIVFEVALYD